MGEATAKKEQMTKTGKTIRDTVVLSFGGLTSRFLIRKTCYMALSFAREAPSSAWMALSFTWTTQTSTSHYTTWERKGNTLLERAQQPLLQGWPVQWAKHLLRL
jgi:hypothetical protein